MTTSSNLTASFRRDGYAVLSDVLDDALVSAARDETVAICRSLRGVLDGMPAADPSRDLAQPTDAEIPSGVPVHPLPAQAVRADGAPRQAPDVVDVLTRVIGPNVKMMQSMLFIKSEGKPGQAWHQDEAYIPTRDRSLTAAWIALDDATVENGCLWVIPGSHRQESSTRPRSGRPRFDCTDEAFDFGYRDADAVPVEVPAGTAVFFNGYLLHRSLPNTGRHGMRRALVNHYMSAESLLPWFPPAPRRAHGARRPPRHPAGRRPRPLSAQNGLTDTMRPHVRPDGNGGCIRSQPGTPPV